MRDLDAYREQGRNSPRDPQQMREHPYDFVSLPNGPTRVEAPGHHKYPKELYSGTLVLSYLTLSPLHVGSGVFESSKECGLAGSDRPVRGILRRDGRPILPGSSWKGAIRSRYEAVTASRLALAQTSHWLYSEKVPGPLQSQPPRKRYKVEIADSRVVRNLKAVRVDSKENPVPQLRNLSPAESLFGVMGYRGRVHPADGAIVSPPPGHPLQVAPMESPAGHRLAQAGQSGNVHGVIKIWTVEGRKFYYDGDVVSSRTTRDGGDPVFELIDSVPARSEIRLEIHLETVTLAELGVLLICSGWEGEAGVLRFGGFKPVGLGKVELSGAEARLQKGRSTRSWKTSDPPLLDLAGAVHAAHESNLIEAAALAELKTVTTLQRPGAEKVR